MDHCPACLRQPTDDNVKMPLYARGDHFHPDKAVPVGRFSSELRFERLSFRVTG